MELDRVNRAILFELAGDGRVSWRDLAERVNITLTPLLRRVRHLEEVGVIEGYSARLSEAKLAGTMTVFVSVQLEKQAEGALRAFENRVKLAPEVMSCHLMTGNADYLLRVVVRDLDDFQAFLLGKLTSIPGVSNIQSSFALKSVVQRFAPLPK